MSDVSLVASENHTRNVSELSVNDTVKELLDINAFYKICEKLTSITNEKFNYFGNIRQESDNVIVSMESEKGNVVEVVVRHTLGLDSIDSSTSENVIFNGLYNLLDDETGLSKERETQEQKIKEHKEKLNNILSDIQEDTEQNIAQMKEEKEERIKEKKKEVLLNVLGINDTEEEPVVEEVKSDKFKQLDNFMEALSNSTITEKNKIKQQRQINKLKNHLDSML